jgi:hypothetical protein
MNCLVCGHKLAIFRKLSLGDFCCQEHRALFFEERSERGSARQKETAEGAGKNQSGGTRVYAQFLEEELPARLSRGGSRGYGPLSAARVISPQAPCQSFSRLAPAREVIVTHPEPGVAAPIGFGVAGIRMRLPAGLQLGNRRGSERLRPAGWILPWSSGAGPQAAFSLAPLAAAAWAQAGYSKPIGSQAGPLDAVQFAWPAIQGKVEMPDGEKEIPAAAFAAVAATAAQPMRVRLTMPAVARHRPQLAMPAAAPAEDLAVYDPPVITPIRDVLAASERQQGKLTTLFSPSPRPAPPTPPKRRLREREEIFGYNAPAPTVSSSSRQAWLAMMSRWTLSTNGASAVFAILFLFSAMAIFYSAPSSLSRPSPSWQWSNLRNAIRSRAVMKVEDDFRSGLNRWVGPAGWAKDWSYDQAGFVRPGKLGFLEESMSLVDYRLEFMGQIERKSLGWTFRAQDEQNYYVAKLTVARSGPLPLVDLIHYLVTDGKEGPKSKVTLPFPVRNDTLYQVEMNIRGDQFRATVNGHVVDSWSDNRLQAGGVGFLNGRGEASRVRWIRVSDRDDLIGQVCSYLTARVYRPSEQLSASYYTIFRHPGTPTEF